MVEWRNAAGLGVTLFGRQRVDRPYRGQVMPHDEAAPRHLLLQRYPQNRPDTGDIVVRRAVAGSEGADRRRGELGLGYDRRSRIVPVVVAEHAVLVRFDRSG